MTRKLRLYADEAWTHHQPLRRYWCFFGGVAGPESDVDRLSHALGVRRQELAVQREIKWSRLSEENAGSYKELTDIFFHHIANHDLRYRQFFTSREYVYAGSDAPLSLLDVQFRLYYQFLKHAFNLKTLPAVSAPTELIVRLDRHSSQKHQKRLATFVEGLPRQLGLVDTTFQVAFVPSHKHLTLQLCDLVMGAAGSYGNKMHELRQVEQRGMTGKQRLRLDFAKHVYQHLRALDANERGTMAFNWFESTGGARSWSDSMRIWKFRPTPHHIDKGWQNDHLVKGEYVGPDIDTTRVLDATGKPYLAS